MRHFSTILAALLPAIVPAIADDVRIAMFDTQRSSSASHDRSVSPETAKLILERRFGQPGSSVVGEAGEQVIQDINEFGGRQLELFESDSQETRRLFLAFEGASTIDMSVLRKYATSDIVSSEELIGLTSLLSSEWSTCSSVTVPADTLAASASLMVPNDARCPWEWVGMRSDPEELDRLLRAVDFRTLLKDSTQNRPGLLYVQSAESSETKMADILSALEELASNFDVETTAIFLPSKPAGFLNKRSPMTRHDMNSEQASHISTPQQSIQSSSSSPESHTNEGISLPRKSPTLSTLMPVCYSSNSSCNDATNGCSGHGSCYKKHGDKAGADGAGDCWACRCKPTVVKTDDNGNPIKTVQWGGPACQKKDVSMPFFLLGGMTVLLVALVAGVVGMMFGMGSEELPGVLSAGVAAPKK